MDTEEVGVEKAKRTVKLYGHSDDCIEIEDVSGDGMTDEFSCFGVDTNYVVFSTGDVFTVRWRGGVWRIEHPTKSGKLEVEIKCCPSDDNDDSYTDVAVITGPFDSVEHWTSWPPDDDDIREKLENALEGLSSEQLRAAYRAAGLGWC